ncbi:MAG: ABC-2 transporter permease [Angelakisella sp.]|jgi:ABC-2 type transport system permease protein|nr:ABC-2 transporter permease [Angelakisella sp.]
MTGLILKDFFTLKKTLIYMVVVILLFNGIYTTAGNSHFSDFFISVMVVSILISTMSYDEYYHWDRYAAILPVSRRQIVGAKYITAFLLFAAGSLLSLALTVGITFFQGRRYSLEDLVIFAWSILVGMIGAAVVLPCYYRFGAQKSRFLMLAFYGIPSVLLVLGLRFIPGFTEKASRLEVTLEVTLEGFLLGGILLTAVALVVSFLTSVRVLEKKELK